MDGTFIPVRDRKVVASPRNYRFSANVRVIIDADTHLVVAAARTTVIADSAYLGTGLIVPHRRSAGRPLLRGQEEDNAEHRRVRARVEHTPSPG